MRNADFSIVPDYKSPEAVENSFKNVSGSDTTFSTFIVKISESEAAGSDFLFQKNDMARHFFERKINTSRITVSWDVEISRKKCGVACYVILFSCCHNV